MVPTRARACCIWAGVACLCVALCVTVLFTRAQGTSSKLTLTVSGRSTVSAELEIAQPFSNTVISSAQSDDVLFAAIPFEYQPAWSMMPADSDVTVALRSSGNGYAVLAIVAPVSKDVVRVKIDNCTTLAETPEGKSKLVFDLSYPHMSPRDSQVLRQPGAVHLWTVEVVLPNEYDVADVSFAPRHMTRVDRRTYRLDTAALPAQHIGEVWIAFPNPAKNSLRLAKLILSFLSGSFALAVEVPPVRKRSLGSAILILSLSCAVLAAALYFYFTLPSRFEFLVWVAAALPSAIFGLGASAYLVPAYLFGVTIVGAVTVDGVGAPRAEVELQCVVDGQWVAWGPTKEIEGSQYVLHRWCSSDSIEVQVKTRAQWTNEDVTGKFRVHRRRRNPAPTVKLVGAKLPIPSASAPVGG